MWRPELDIDMVEWREPLDIMLPMLPIEFRLVMASPCS